MADLLGEDGAQTQQEEDPAAAFLAREQDDLAGLEDDSIGGSGNEPPPVPGEVYFDVVLGSRKSIFSRCQYSSVVVGVSDFKVSKFR